MPDYIMVLPELIKEAKTVLNVISTYLCNTAFYAINQVGMIQKKFLIFIFIVN